MLAFNICLHIPLALTMGWGIKESLLPIEVHEEISYLTQKFRSLIPLRQTRVEFYSRISQEAHSCVEKAAMIGFVKLRILEPGLSKPQFLTP